MLAVVRHSFDSDMIYYLYLSILIVPYRTVSSLHANSMPWQRLVQNIVQNQGLAGQFSDTKSGACQVCPPGSFSEAAWL